MAAHKSQRLDARLEQGAHVPQLASAAPKARPRGATGGRAAQRGPSLEQSPAAWAQTHRVTGGLSWAAARLPRAKTRPETDNDHWATAWSLRPFAVVHTLQAALHTF